MTFADNEIATETSPDEGWTSPSENPMVAQAAIDAAMGGDEVQIPSISAPPEGTIRLLVPTADGRRDVEYEELNGWAEERLAKVDQDTQVGKYLQTLLECGVSSIGGKDPSSEDLLDLLIGDRENILRAIRIATYGPLIEFGEARCPSCGNDFDLTINLETDVPIRPMSGDTQFTVPLRRGGKATVRLPNGADQVAYFDDPDLTDAERKTIMLSRVVLNLEAKSGERQNVAGLGSLVGNLGLQDRNNILTEIAKRQPGPRYDEVVLTHECGHSKPFSVGLMHLFPGI